MILSARQYGKFKKRMSSNAILTSVTEQNATTLADKVGTGSGRFNCFSCYRRDRINNCVSVAVCVFTTKYSIPPRHVETIRTVHASSDCLHRALEKVLTEYKNTSLHERARVIRMFKKAFPYEFRQL